jgi:hypothetical protein
MRLLMAPAMRTAGARPPHTRTRAPRGTATAQVTVLYSLANEPWLKYSMSAVADRGLRPSAWTSARLARGGEVLYLETNR